MQDAIILYLHFEVLIYQGLILLNLETPSSNVDKKMSLAVAAWRDMILMIIQDRDYVAFKKPDS